MTQKSAILLYGFLRTYKTAAKSLLNKVAIPNNADIFLFTYDNEGLSITNGNEDLHKTKRKYGALQDSLGNFVTEKILRDTYGDRLKSFSLQKEEDFKEKFKIDSLNIYSPYFPIERFYSLYFNITGVTKLLLNYEKNNDILYDNIILARPDLNFYSQINLNDYDLNNINIANYGGNINESGKNEAYYCCYYKNVKRCEYIPFKEVIFSDQLIISQRENLIKLATLYDKLNEYNKYGLPVCHPETILYYHLCLSQNLKVQTNNIKYEILRNNYIEKTNEIINYSINNNDKYKNKVQNDIKNIKIGVSSLFNLPLNLIKATLKRGKNPNEIRCNNTNI